MKRFLTCVLLTACLLLSACTGIASPDGADSADLSVSKTESSYESADFDMSENSVSADEESGENSQSLSAESGGEDLTGASSESADGSSDAASSDDTSDADVTSESSIGGTSDLPEGSVYISNGILIAGDRGMEQYFGSPESGNNCSKMIADFKNDLGDGVEVYTVVAPHTSCYYAPESYSNLIERGRLNFENLKEHCASNVHYVDVYNALWQHVDEPIYHRTELHWAALAGYYAAEAFAKEANVSFPPLDSYEKIVKPGYVGSAYTFSKADVIKNNPEDFVIYMPKTEYTAYYYNEGNYDLSKPSFQKDSIVFDTMGYAGAFICGDSYTIKVVTANNTGRKLVIFKYSYGNAFAPFTLASFDISMRE